MSMSSSLDYNATTVPAFLSKLWTLVEDPATDEFICWDLNGKYFHVFDQARFAKEILPLYFKHSNIASFIRQLNMYGFRKLSSIDSGSLKVERDDLVFHHQYFHRDNEPALEHIKRKPTGMTRSLSTEEVKLRVEEVDKVLTDVHHIQGQQTSMSSKLENIKKENEALWREIANLRQKHSKQQTIVNKLVQFLVHLVSSSRGVPGLKRQLPMLPEPEQKPTKVPKLSDSRCRPGDTSGTCTLYEITSPSDSSASGEHGSSLGQTSQESLLFTDPTTLNHVSLDSTVAPSVTTVSPDLDLVTQANDFLPTLENSELNGASVSSLPKVTTQSDLNGQLENMETEIDTLKDILSSGNYFIDNDALFDLFSPSQTIPPFSNDLFTVADPTDIGSLANSIKVMPDDANNLSTIPGQELTLYEHQDEIGDLLSLSSDQWVNPLADSGNPALNTPAPVLDKEPQYGARMGGKMPSLMEEVD